MRQEAAATCVQAAWRSHVQRQAYLRIHSKVVHLQAVFRGWRVRNSVLEAKGAVVVFESLWVRRKAMLQLSQAVQAAKLMQAAWRARQVRLEHQRRAAAATTLQAAIRSWSTRREVARMQHAAVVLQSCVRAMLARHAAARHRAMCKAIEDLRKTARDYMLRARAGRFIQACWRGYLVRKQYGPALREALQRSREARAAATIQKAWRKFLNQKDAQQREEQMEHARSVISSWVPAFRARLALLRAQRERSRRAAAAAVIQSYVRMWLVRRRTDALIMGITRLQALWRGYRVRQAAGRSKEALRLKLRAVMQAAHKQPSHKSIGQRTREALELVLVTKEPEKMTLAISAMEMGTRYSSACCALIANSGVPALLRMLRSCNRSKPHVDLQLAALAVLSHVCKYSDLVPLVFAADDCITVLSEKLQLYRDMEDVFMATIGLLERLVAPEPHAVEVARMPGILKQWEGVAQVLAKKLEMERKSLHRVEDEKGSDATAKEATRKVLSSAKQVHALQALVGMVVQAAERHGIPLPENMSTSGASGAAVGKPKMPAAAQLAAKPVPTELVQPEAWQPKNTIIRTTKETMTHTNKKILSKEAGVNAAIAAAVEAAGGQAVSAVKTLAVSGRGPGMSSAPVSRRTTRQ